MPRQELVGGGSAGRLLNDRLFRCRILPNMTFAGCYASVALLVKMITIWCGLAKPLQVFDISFAFIVVHSPRNFSTRYCLLLENYIRIHDFTLYSRDHHKLSRVTSRVEKCLPLTFAQSLAPKVHLQCDSRLSFRAQVLPRSAISSLRLQHCFHQLLLIARHTRHKISERGVIGCCKLE